MKLATWFCGAVIFSSLSGCAVATVADAAVSAGATVVKAGAAAVGTAVDLATAGIKAVVPSDEKNSQATSSGGR